ncbi:MAG: ABC transporter permease subunit [Alphaproteobacteria bacterium]|nr:ABC transporter permease subunit [Alphaproteobacteria bacterium]
MRPPDRRAGSVQLLIYLAVAAVAVAAALFAIETLRARGIKAGFGFLWNTAGFDIGFTLIPFDATSSYGRAFLAALLNTLLVSGLAIVLASAIGLVVAVARLAPIPAIRAAGTTYVEAVRNTPLLLQLLALYFLLLGALPPPRQSLAFAGVLVNNRGVFVPAPSITVAAAYALLALVALAIVYRLYLRRLGPVVAGFSAAGAAALGLAALSLMRWDLPALRGLNVQGGLALVPEFAVLVTALAVYTAAFVAETFRSGFLAVPPGQWEAGVALGLGRARTLRLVVLPQAVRAALPPLASQYVNVIKASSLAAAVGFPDLMQVFGKTTLNQTGQAVEVIAMTMAVYLAISMAVAGATQLYERSGQGGARA